ncbi:hypothetical protein D9M69_522430 [compost metagenome]
MGSFPFIFPLSLYFYNLFVPANTDAGVEGYPVPACLIDPINVKLVIIQVRLGDGRTPEIYYRVLYGKIQLFMRLHLIGDFQVILRQGMKPAKIPGPVKKLLISFFTHLFPEDIHQGDVVAVSIHQRASPLMIRRIMKVGFSRSDDQAVHLLIPVKYLVDE